MPLPTVPSGISVTAQAATSITLAWTVGAGDHYDVYRAPVRRGGYFGPFAKVNSSNVSIAATGYVDSSVLSGSNAPTANQHYCYIVYAVASDSSQLAGEPVFATSFDGTDATELIEEAILARAAGVLALDSDNWHELPFVGELEKNSTTQGDEAYGVLVGEGPVAATRMGEYRTTKRFRFMLSKKVTKGNQDDSALKDGVKELSALMEKCSIDFQRSKLALPTVVTHLARIPTGAPEFYQESNLLVLPADLAVTYRISLS